jgi:hypothetical protein
MLGVFFFFWGDGVLFAHLFYSTGVQTQGLAYAVQVLYQWTTSPALGFLRQDHHAVWNDPIFKIPYKLGRKNSLSSGHLSIYWGWIACTMWVHSDCRRASQHCYKGWIEVNGQLDQIAKGELDRSADSFCSYSEGRILLQCLLRDTKCKLMCLGLLQLWVLRSRRAAKV